MGKSRLKRTLCVRTDADGLAVGGAYLVVVNHRCSVYGGDKACDNVKEEEDEQSQREKSGPPHFAQVFGESWPLIQDGVF